MQGVSQTIVCCVDVQGVYEYVTLFSCVKCFLNAGMADCPASGQSSTGMDKNADARTSPVQECSGIGLRYRMPECQNADARGIGLYAFAPLEF